MGGYENWAGVMGGILGACGIPGWLANLAKLREHADADTAAWGAFYGRWWGLMGDLNTQAKDVYEAFCEDDALVGMLGDRSDHAKKIAFGRLLTKRVGVVANGYRVEKVTGRAGVSAFRLSSMGAIPTKIEGYPPHTHHDSQVQMGGVSGSMGLFPNLMHGNNYVEREITYRDTGKMTPHTPHTHHEENWSEAPDSEEDDLWA